MLTNIFSQTYSWSLNKLDAKTSSSLLCNVKTILNQICLLCKYPQMTSIKQYPLFHSIKYSKISSSILDSSGPRHYHQVLFYYQDTVKAEDVHKSYFPHLVTFYED